MIRFISLRDRCIIHSLSNVLQKVVNVAELQEIPISTRELAGALQENHKKTNK